MALFRSVQPLALSPHPSGKKTVFPPGSGLSQWVWQSRATTPGAIYRSEQALDTPTPLLYPLPGRQLGWACSTPLSLRPPPRCSTFMCRAATLYIAVRQFSTIGSAILFLAHFPRQQLLPRKVRKSAFSFVICSI